MQSTVFISEAQSLIHDVKVFSAAWLDSDEEQRQGTNLQRRINMAFGGLQNPTLPSAYKLRDAALNAGFYVDPKRQHWIASFENLRG